MLGKNIRSARERKGLTQSELGEMLNVTWRAVSNWERGERTPRYKTLEDIAAALNVPVTALLGDDAPPPEDPVITPISDMIDVPVYDLRSCAGLGTPQEYADIEIVDTLRLPGKWVGRQSPDEDKRPFAVQIDGDSMSDAGLPDGALAIVNPAEEVYSGMAALVAFGDRQDIALKYVVFHKDGAIELRSANPEFPPYIYSREEQLADRGDMPPVVQIIGRVMGSWGSVKRL